MRPIAVFCCLAFLLCLKQTCSAEEDFWKIGVARSNITPTNNLWMSGYASRKHPANGKLTDLWLKVLALEDDGHHRAVIITTDLIAIRGPLYKNCIPRLQAHYGLKPEQILLTASHTHCGPWLPNQPGTLSSLDPDERRLIEQYADHLADQVVETTGKALAELRPALVVTMQGNAGFAANRRNDPEPERQKRIQKQTLVGPVEHSVPVLAAYEPDGKLYAVLFGYACHNTTLTGKCCQYCGDYAGFAQEELERSHPGATALFFQGCAGDQDPVIRGNVDLARRYGNMLAAAVEECLLVPSKPLPSKLKTTMETIPLDFGSAPTKAELISLTNNPTGYIRRWAVGVLSDINAGRTLRRNYKYPIQIWCFGGRQILVTLGGEPVVDYALKFKRMLGSQTWVAGYANEVMCYIPSLRVLNEDKPPLASKYWGYEGSQAMIVMGLPAWRWGDDVEELITASVQRLAEQAGPVAGKIPSK